jgi:hypothetical protein
VNAIGIFKRGAMNLSFGLVFGRIWIPLAVSAWLALGCASDQAPPSEQDVSHDTDDAAPTKCIIGEGPDAKVYEALEGNPDNACESCQPAISSSDWSAVTDGTACDDGNETTVGDGCQDGICVGTDHCSEVVCTALDQCHDAGVCDPGTGECSNPERTDGTPCDDDNACTQIDTCKTGTCLGTDPVTCSAIDDCHKAGECDAGTGECSNPAADDNTPCDDQLACTTDDLCTAGACAGTAVGCDDELNCTIDSCNDADGTCTHTIADGNCLIDGACYKADDVNEGNPCKWCIPVDSANTWSPAPVDTPCDDGYPCTSADTCLDGVCTGGAATDCNDQDTCTDDSCDDATGCVYSSNTAACEDGDACTTGDTCNDGKCEGGKAPNCDDQDACTDDSCDSQKGCVYSNNAGACDDGDACTTGDTCTDGKCVGGKPLKCGDPNPCTDDSCDSKTGCVNANNTAACNDSDACTATDACDGGECVGGKAPNCDDANLCTDDGCKPESGCFNTNNTDGCDDGDECTSADTCSNGKCVSGKTLDCNDKNPCTVDSCDAKTGCVNANNSEPCDDGDACTTADSCSDSQCVGGKAPDCNDDDLCTDDSCNSSSGCANVYNTAACNDGNACTTVDACASGKCIGSTPPNCNDNNPCTHDTCDAKTGCKSINNTAACNDGDECTTADTCAAGKCIGGKAPNCDDANLCTNDTCEAVTGCVNANNTAVCDDDDACTTVDICGNGKCVGDSPPKCNDSNPCTDDSCDSDSGCVNTNNAAVCSDGQGCTANDVCSGGSCTTGSPISCDDKKACTADSCVDKGGNNYDCSNDISAGSCLVDGVCYSQGTINPGNKCVSCNTSGSQSAWTALQANNPCDKPGYWNGVARDMPVSPYGNIAAIACHNCYHTSSTSTSATTNIIAAAIAKKADLIELDIYEHKGVIRVHHNDGEAAGPTLGNVLANSTLKSADQLLFIEIKESQPTKEFIGDVLDLIQEHGYARYGRPAIIRTFNSKIANISYAKELLTQNKYADIAPYIRLHVLFSKNEKSSVESMQDLILNVSYSKYHGVEFNYQNKNLFGLLAYAKSKGLGIALWTVPVSMGEVFVANVRNEVDAIIVDYPIDKAREVVEEPNGLIYLNVWDQTNNGSLITYYRKNNKTNYTFTAGSGTNPVLKNSAKGEDLFGGYLQFTKNMKQYLKFYDADNDAAYGYFLTVVVNFDALSIANGDTNSIIAKTDGGSFALELYRAGPFTPTVLRCAMHVNGSYHYASYPVAYLNDTDSYFVTCAYDGDGKVRLWINNSDSSVSESSSVKGGVTLNNSPVLMGADPQGATAQRFHSSIKVQQMSLQKWSAH